MQQSKPALEYAVPHVEGRAPALAMFAPVYAICCIPQAIVLWRGLRVDWTETGWNEVLPGSFVLCPAGAMMRWIIAVIALVMLLRPSWRQHTGSALWLLPIVHIAISGALHLASFWSNFLD
jgi:hypothetical protein